MQIIFLFVLAGLIGCGPKYIESTMVHDIEKYSVHLIAFIPLLDPPAAPGQIRSTTIAEGATQIVTDQLYHRLLEHQLIVSRWQGDEAQPFGIENGSLSDVQQAQQIGRLLKTPAVLFGTVDAFAEREGSAMGIRKPASIGFTVQLIHTEDGRLLWKASYHETQKSLLEDITTLPLFFKRKGRWLTAAELSDDGVDEILSVSPWAKTKTTSDVDHPSN